MPQKIMPQYRITVLGPSGVGKTSILTGMCETFDSLIAQIVANTKNDDERIQITIDPESGTLIRINSCLVQLKSLTEKNNNFEIQPGQGLGGTSEPVLFEFNMGIAGKENALTLLFQDYPGGWVEKDPENMNKVVEFLKNSVAILIPIDAPAMMERNGKYHESVNLSKTVDKLIQKACQELDSPRLLILAPVKCEKYIQENRTEELLRCVEEKYTKLISYCKTTSDLRSKIGVVITPIQTVGNVLFTRIDEPPEPKPKSSQQEPQQEQPKIENAIFYFFRKKAAYEPKDCEQPLKYLLQFIFKLHILHIEEKEKKGFWPKWLKEKKGFWPKWLEELLELNLDAPFKEAAAKFTQQPPNPNCKVLQGEHLLNINIKE